MKCGHHGEAKTCYLSSFRAMHVDLTTYLWYGLSLFLVLYWDEFQTLFSILRAFLVLLRRLLMSLPAPSLYPKLGEL